LQRISKIELLAQIVNLWLNDDGCKFDKQTTYTAVRGSVLGLEEGVTDGGGMLADVDSQYNVFMFTSKVVLQANHASGLSEEARMVTLRMFGSRSVRADFEENKWDVAEAEGEVTSGFVIILVGLSTVLYFGNQWKLPGLATRENRLTHEMDDGAGWECTRNRMPHFQDIARN